MKPSRERIYRILGARCSAISLEDLDATWRAARRVFPEFGTTVPNLHVLGSKVSMFEPGFYDRIKLRGIDDDFGAKAG